MSHSDKASSKSKPLVRPPDNIYTMLMELSINYAVQMPGQFADYAVKYFTKIREMQEAIRLAEASEPSITTELVSTVPDEDLSLPSQLVRHRSVRGDPCDINCITAEMEADYIPKTGKVRSFLSRNMRRSILFRTLDRKLMMQVISIMPEVELGPGDYLMKQGEVTDTLYVVENGFLDAVITVPGEEPRLLTTYKRESIFGEIALFHVVASGVSIQATSKVTLWSIERSEYRHMLLQANIKKRDARRRLLAPIAMLRNLKKEEREKLADCLKLRTFSRGSWIFRQNDASDGLYIIEQGMVLLTIPGEMEKHIVVNRLSKRQVFGEPGLVSNSPRRVNAFAIQKTRVQFLDAEDFERIVGPCLDVLKRTQEDYNNMLLKIFGQKDFITDLREIKKPKKYRRKRVLRRRLSSDFSLY